MAYNVPLRKRNVKAKVKELDEYSKNKNIRKMYKAINEFVC